MLLTCVNIDRQPAICTAHKRTCRERPVCRSAGLRNKKKHLTKVPHACNKTKTERHMGRSLQNGVMVVLFMLLSSLCPLLHLLLPPTISIRCRRRVSGTGNQLAGCLPGRPELQHVAGCKILFFSMATQNLHPPKNQPLSPLIESSWSS